jgi:flagellar motor switch protein FliN/FliY
MSTVPSDASLAIVQQLASSAPGISTSAPSGGEDWGAKGREAVLRIPVSVSIVLGSTRMPVSKLMALKRGSTVQLDRKVGDLVDIVVNDRVVARGEIIVIQEDGDQYAVVVRQVVGSEGE